MRDNWLNYYQNTKHMFDEAPPPTTAVEQVDIDRKYTKYDFPMSTETFSKMVTDRIKARNQNIEDAIKSYMTEYLGWDVELIRKVAENTNNFRMKGLEIVNHPAGTRYIHNGKVFLTVDHRSDSISHVWKAWTL